MLFVIIYLFAAHLIGNYAKHRGESYLKWFIASIIIDPVLAFMLIWLRQR